jgi:hypothetical protein
MTITLNIHESWSTAVPVALSRVLAGLAALERPRAPGDDLDDLSELLDGINDPEPAPAVTPAATRPAAAPAATPSPAAATPRAGRPSARPFDGVPTTGQGLYRWSCDHKALPRVNAIGKSFGYPKRVVDWEPGQVAAAYAILTAEPSPNGRPR